MTKTDLLRLHRIPTSKDTQNQGQALNRSIRNCAAKPCALAAPRCSVQRLLSPPSALQALTITAALRVPHSGCSSKCPQQFALCSSQPLTEVKPELSALCRPNMGRSAAKVETWEPWEVTQLNSVRAAAMSGLLDRTCEDSSSSRFDRGPPSGAAQAESGSGIFETWGSSLVCQLGLGMASVEQLHGCS